jgi:hypothetical protein
MTTAATTADSASALHTPKNESCHVGHVAPPNRGSRNKPRLQITSKFLPSSDIPIIPVKWPPVRFTVFATRPHAETFYAIGTPSPCNNISLDCMRLESLVSECSCRSGGYCSCWASALVSPSRSLSQFGHWIPDGLRRPSRLSGGRRVSCRASGRMMQTS